MKQYESIHLSIPASQLRSMSKGKAVIIKPEHHGGAMSLHLGALKYKKLLKAKEKKKGVRLSLDPKEIEYNVGKGFFDTLKKVAKSKLVKDIIQHPTTKKFAEKAISKLEPLVEKGIEQVLEKPLGKKTASKISKAVTSRASKYVSKKVQQHTTPTVAEELPTMMMSDIEEGGKIDFKKLAKTVSKGYKKYVKPIASPLIRKGLQKGVELGTRALETVVPEASPLIQTVSDKYGDKAVDFVMKKTGLGVRLEDNYSGFLNPQHPGMKPPLPMPDFSLPRFRRSDRYGGSFFPAGYRGGSFMMAGQRRYQGGATGLPNDPLLPEKDFSTYY